MNSRLPAISHIPASPRNAVSTLAAVSAIRFRSASAGSAWPEAAQELKTESRRSNKVAPTGTSRVSGRDNTAMMPHI